MSLFLSKSTKNVVEGRKIRLMGEKRNQRLEMWNGEGPQVFKFAIYLLQINVVPEFRGQLFVLLLPAIKNCAVFTLPFRNAFQM